MNKLNRKSRLPLLDTVRGITMISMIAYHACWDFVYLLGFSWNWYNSRAGFLWQQSICWTFILLSGFCIPFSNHLWKRGLQVFGAGALVTAVTLAVLPEDRVVFGVLTLIGSCMLLMACWKTITGKRIDNSDERKAMPVLWAAVFFLLFLFAKNVNSGFLQIGAQKIVLPTQIYSNLFTTYLGFPAPDFYSTDYFSLIPWVFLYLTGYHLHGVCRKYGFFERGIFGISIAPFAFLGRHSLFIYLLHQPVLYVIVLLIQTSPLIS